MYVHNILYFRKCKYKSVWRLLLIKHVRYHITMTIRPTEHSMFITTHNMSLNNDQYCTNGK